MRIRNNAINCEISWRQNNNCSLRSVNTRDLQSFNLTILQDKNLGLINQALEHAARWSIRKLTGTYLTLHISDIGQAVGIDSEDEVRALILDMVSPVFTFIFFQKKS